MVVCGIDLAFEAAENNPESVLLMGVPAEQADMDFGWIEAEAAISTDTSQGLLKVKRFWEKPSRRTAQDLFERGCVWNTFVMVGRAQAFMDMIQSGAPSSLAAVPTLVDVTGSPLEWAYCDSPLRTAHDNRLLKGHTRFCARSDSPLVSGRCRLE